MRKLIYLSILLLGSWTIKEPPKTIVLQPYGDFPKEYTEYVKVRLNLAYPNVLIAQPILLPKSSLFYGRYRADTLIALLSRNAKSNTIMVGLTDKDITSTKGSNNNWGIFGLGYNPGNACTISSFRLNKANKSVELFKTVIHEIGHTEGLPHCPVAGCYMEDADGKNKFNQEHDFCTKCKTYLKTKGWNL